AALHGVVFDESFLDGMQNVADGEAFDGANLALADFNGERHARADGLAIEPDRAGRARAAIADDLRTREIEIDAERFGEGGARLDTERVIGAIDAEGQRSGAGAKRLGDVFGLLLGCGRDGG